jgi:hypothetical protein
MRRGYKIDIVAAQILEAEHDLGQPIRRDLSSFSQVADFVILAEKAEQIAVGKKDRPRPSDSHQGLLLAEVGVIT